MTEKIKQSAGVALYGLSYKGVPGIYTVLPGSIGRYAADDVFVPEVGKGSIDPGEDNFTAGVREYGEEIGPFLDTLGQYFKSPDKNLQDLFGFIGVGEETKLKKKKTRPLEAVEKINANLLPVEPVSYRSFGQEIGQLSLYACIVPDLTPFEQHLKGKKFIDIRPDGIAALINPLRAAEERIKGLPTTHDVIRHLLETYDFKKSDRKALNEVLKIEDLQEAQASFQDVIASKFNSRYFYNVTKGWKMLMQERFPGLRDDSEIKPCGLTCRWFAEVSAIVPLEVARKAVDNFLSITATEERTLRHQRQWSGDRDTQGLRTAVELAHEQVLSRIKHYAPNTEGLEALHKRGQQHGR